MENCLPALEAILFSSPRPVRAESLADLLAINDADSIHEALRRLNDRYRNQARPYRIVATVEGYRLELNDHSAPEEPMVRPRRLSASTLETLAIITYLQPITEAEVKARLNSEVRPAIRLLCQLGWVQRQLGCDDLEGEARLSTTPALLEHLGMASLADLPPAQSLAKI